MACGSAVDGRFEFAKKRSRRRWCNIDEDIVGGEFLMTGGGAACFGANGNLRIWTCGAFCGGDQVAGDVVNLSGSGLAGAGGKEESQEAKKQGPRRNMRSAAHRNESLRCADCASLRMRA